MIVEVPAFNSSSTFVSSLTIVTKKSELFLLNICFCSFHSSFVVIKNPSLKIASGYNGLTDLTEASINFFALFQMTEMFIGSDTFFKMTDSIVRSKIMDTS